MTHIEKIKKLLRLSRSANPHEAELAMAKAMQLAAEHRIAIDGINPDAETPTITHKTTAPWQRVPYDKQYASKIAEVFFGISVVHERIIIEKESRQGYRYMERATRLIFIGTESDLAIAGYVFEFLTKHFSYCWRNHRGRCKKRQSFVYGMYVAIFQMLHSARPNTDNPQGTQLDISHRDYIAQLFDNVETTKTKRPKTSDGSFNRGFERGLSTQIRPAIPTTERQPLKLNR